MDLNTAVRMRDVHLPVELSERERKGLKRIIGGEVDAIAWLTVRVKVKHEAEPAVPESGPVASGENQHQKSVVEKVS